MSPQSPDAVFASVHAAAQQGGSARLFTVTVLDRAARLARRAYTSHPVEYPTSGTKPMNDNAWAAQVVGRGQTFVANSTAEFAPYFADHALINALGCAAAANLPVADASGLVVGTVNVLDGEGSFPPERVAALEALIATRRADLLAAMAAVPMERPA